MSSFCKFCQSALKRLVMPELVIKLAATISNDLHKSSSNKCVQSPSMRYYKHSSFILFHSIINNFIRNKSISNLGH